MQNRLLIIVLTAILISSCEDHSPDFGQSPTTTNGRVLDPFAFRNAEFINTLPDGRSLSFSHASGGFHFTNTPSGYHFTEVFRPKQIDLSGLYYGEGDLKVGDVDYEFQIVTCIPWSDSDELFPEEQQNPIPEGYQYIIAIGSVGTLPPTSGGEYNPDHMLILILPYPFIGPVSLPDNRYDAAAISFVDFKNEVSFDLESAQITKEGGPFQLSGTFTNDTDELAFDGRLTCGD